MPISRELANNSRIGCWKLSRQVACLFNRMRQPWTMTSLLKFLLLVQILRYPSLACFDFNCFS